MIIKTTTILTFRNTGGNANTSIDLDGVLLDYHEGDEIRYRHNARFKNDFSPKFPNEGNYRVVARQSDMLIISHDESHELRRGYTMELEQGETQ